MLRGIPAYQKAHLWREKISIIIYYLKSTGCANGFCSFAPQGYFFGLNPYGRDLCPPEKLPFKFFRAASSAARTGILIFSEVLFNLPLRNAGAVLLPFFLFCGNIFVKDVLAHAGTHKVAALKFFNRFAEGFRK